MEDQFADKKVGRKYPGISVTFSILRRLLHKIAIVAIGKRFVCLFLVEYKTFGSHPPTEVEKSFSSLSNDLFVGG